VSRECHSIISRRSIHIYIYIYCPTFNISKLQLVTHTRRSSTLIPSWSTASPRGSLRESTLRFRHVFQHTIQLALGFEGIETFEIRWTVVESADVRSFDPNCGDGSSTESGTHYCTDCLAVFLLVQFYRCVFGTLFIKQFFRFDTVGSCCK